MEFGNQIILVGAGLIMLSIFAGLVSSRIGAPLLLVFLVLGMLAGEDGPGGIEFDDFRFAYLFGSIALAIILFDSGLRTSYQRLRAVIGPSLILATVAVLITAAGTGAAAYLLLGFNWTEALLMGSIVASTDAAAVFFLLHLRGSRLKERVGATLEVESGLNDPMAVFLTVVFVELIVSHVEGPITLDAAGSFAGTFLLQMAGGAAAGIAGGLLLVHIINRIELAPGLYPIFAVSGAVLVFAGTQEFGGSGFLSVYIAGLIVGNRRHRGMLLITRFHDGLSWLCQIGMFLMLGLLVTPSTLVPVLPPALAIAAALIVVSRPAAVAACLFPFGYTLREILFVSWVGLRGAVPIFLATIPVLAGVAHAMTMFAVVYVVVLASLVVQGWTVTYAARRLDLHLPPRPEPPQRAEIDLPVGSDRDMAAYTVHSTSMVARRNVDRLPVPEGVNIVSVIRDGAMQNLEALNRLAPGDYVLMLAPSEHLATVDRLFAPSVARATRSQPEELLGEFVFDGDAPIGALADQYGFHVPADERELPVGTFMIRHLRRRPQAGSSLGLGDVELVVRRIDDERITRASLDLNPEPRMVRSLDALRIRLGGWLRPLLAAGGSVGSRSVSRLFRLWGKASGHAKD